MDGCNAVYTIHYARRYPVYDKTYTRIYFYGNGDCTSLNGICNKILATACRFPCSGRYFYNDESRYKRPKGKSKDFV